jgi:hypothetical protein
MQHLAEAGNVLQTLFDDFSSRLQLEPTIGAEESLTVEDDKSADIHSLTEIARVQHEQVIGGKAFHNLQLSPRLSGFG